MQFGDYYNKNHFAIFCKMRIHIGLADSGFCKAIGMSSKRHIEKARWKEGCFWATLVMLLLVIGCQQAGEDISALPGDETIAEAELSKQLKINRDALFKGSSERIRIDAASVMLFAEDPFARALWYLKHGNRRQCQIGRGSSVNF